MFKKRSVPSLESFELINAVATIIGTTTEVANTAGKALRKNTPTDLLVKQRNSQLKLGFQI